MPTAPSPSCNDYYWYCLGMLRTCRRQGVIHMSLERILLIAIWTVTIIGLVLLTPRKQIRPAIVIFMFKQIMTWLFGLLVVEYRLISYPVREFVYASKTSFSFEYFIYPAICVVFVLRYPERKSVLHRIGWYVFFPTWMTIAEVLIERYTLLISFLNWSWYWTWITLFLTFTISRLFYLWFMRKNLAQIRGQ